MCYFWNVSKKGGGIYVTQPFQAVSIIFGQAERGMADAPDCVRFLQHTRIPNAEEYKKAKNKYKTWDNSAITEYTRLVAVNARIPLVASSNKVEHPRYYYLTELRSRCEFVVVLPVRQRYLSL
jgi:hypothetical protein